MNKIYYYVVNGGDGSATPRFFERLELAEICQDLELELYGEGWAEDCTGLVDVPQTTEDYLAELEAELSLDYWDERERTAYQKAVDRIKALR